jgi:hypothetical protein
LLSDAPITSVTLSPTGTRTSNPNTAKKQEEGKEENCSFSGQLEPKIRGII